MPPDPTQPPLVADPSPPIPRLADLPVDRWYEALAPLTREQRRRAVNTVATLAQVSIALRLVTRLELGEPPPFARRAAACAAPVLPDPGDGASPHRSRQVNFRLRPEDFEVLREAARLHGTTPTHLARVLAMRGSRRALADEEAARERARR